MPSSTSPAARSAPPIQPAPSVRRTRHHAASTREARRPGTRPIVAALALASVLPWARTDAQLAVLRTSTAAPFEADSGRRFPRPMFVGSLARGYGSEEDAQAWNATLAGVAALRSRSGRTAVVLQVGHEMTANPYNSGGLNPRGAAWEEAIDVVRRLHVLDVSGGVFFRCRHEIDGSTPIDERPGAPPSRIGTRIVMTKGVQLALGSRELTVAPRTRLRLSVSGDRFTAREDWRVPESSAGPHWAESRGRVAGTVRISHALSAASTAYARGWASTTFFAPAAAAADSTRAARGGTGARLESGLRFGGAGGGTVDTFVAAERFFDDLSHPVPRASRVLAVGLRIGSGAFY